MPKQTSNEFTPVSPVTPNQKVLAQAFKQNQIVLCKGPAGSGKTLLAMSEAIASQKQQLIRQILYTRPIVQFEALQGIGYLPGDAKEKLAPLLYPVQDNLNKLCNAGLANYLLSKQIVQPVLIQDLRGRSLSDTVLIVDEAQSLTIKDMELCLTRCDERSKVFMLADLRQKDSFAKYESGFAAMAAKLAKLDGIAYVELSYDDVQRGSGLVGLVQRLFAGV